MSINKKIILKDNLTNNFNYCNNIFNNICAMVKANAYGSNLKAFVKILDNKLNYYGVANEAEALALRKLTNKKIIIFGKCENYLKIINKNIDFCIDNIFELKKVLAICKKSNLQAKIHLAINTGMNREGIKTLTEYKEILHIISQNNQFCLCGIFTHCYDGDCKTSHFYQQMKMFYQFVKLAPKDILVHIGGSFVLNYKIPSFVNLVRVGYFLYGYGNKFLKPVMRLESKVTKITACKKWEQIGYGNKCKLKKSTNIALVPIGYADGLPRCCSNKLLVKINDKHYKIIGNVCMDMFMVDIKTDIVKIGDRVVVVDDANKITKLTKSSNYETLTNFSKVRAKCLIN
ncbi:MAG: alanine racemase [Clostridiales bacterium]|nr:alanine racemase [Clostridiales bacterium]